MWQQSARYPDPAVMALSPAFRRYMLSAAGVEQLWTGGRWCEGPVWIGDLRCLLWSDIPNDRVMKWDEATGEVCTWQKPSRNANGHTRDRQGRIIACEHLARRVVRFEHDGSLTVLASHYQGKPLNSPNDVVVRSDGSVWFSDPPFGIGGFYEGAPATPELPPTRLYRIDPGSGELQIAADDLRWPNGLAFSPDERRLYVVESRAEPRAFACYDVAADGRSLGPKQCFHECPPGESPDGFRVDVQGNLWCGWGGGEGRDGVRVISPAGEAIGHIHLPERAANLCFGGLHRNRLFITASRSLYALYVNTQGAVGG